jgi:hypothetical protein
LQGKINAQWGLVGSCEGKRTWKTCDFEWEVYVKKCILKKHHGAGVLDSSGSIQEHVAGCCEHGNEPSAPIKCGVFLDCLGKIMFSRRTQLRGVT